MCSSSDQEVNGMSSAESNCTSSRDSSETPEQGSTLSGSRGTESDNAHSDSSAIEEVTSETYLRRRRHRHRLETSTDSSSSTNTTGGTVSQSSSSDGRTEIVAGERIGLALSTPNGQTDSFGAQLQSGRTGLGHTGPGVASLEQYRGGRGEVGTFSSLQQRKEEMLKRARQ